MTIVRSTLSRQFSAKFKTILAGAVTISASIKAKTLVFFGCKGFRASAYCAALWYRVIIKFMAMVKEPISSMSDLKALARKTRAAL